MSTEEFSLDAFLDAVPVSVDDISGSIPGEPDRAESWVEPGYEGKIDYRIRQLSYSSVLTLHTCARKYQLYKLRSSEKLPPSPRSQVTFAFGHLVGQGIQEVLMGYEWDKVLWNLFLNWDTDLFAENEKEGKSFWHGVLAIKRFIAVKNAGALKDYELVYYKDRPAVELSFCIILPDGFRYRGFVDAVLRHRITGEILVLECKTTKSKALNPNKYRNSAQGIGYSIVLDSLFPDWSSYKVLYWVYQSTAGEYTPLPFTKTFLQRALWIRELLLDMEMIKLYEEAEVYPMHGESCVTYSMETEKESNVWEGDCEYINVCTMSTSALTKKATPADEDKTDYQIVLTLTDLLEAQLSKVTE
jgi:hypothetical protein